MPFTGTKVIITEDEIAEMFGAIEAPPESVVRAKPNGEWRLDDADGNWRFWRYYEE